MRKTILVKGPVLSQSGYGEQARFALRALKTREDIFDIYICPISWGKTGWVSLNNEERRWIDERVSKYQTYAQHGGSYDISLQITIPNEWEKLAHTNIGYTAGIETTRVSPLWIQKANEMDHIIVVSNHSRDTYKGAQYRAQHPQTGQIVLLECDTPFTVVNYPVRSFDTQKLNLNLEHNFNFLAISQWGPRKNFDNLINWFIEENYDQDVGLILKTSIRNNSIMDRIHTEHRLKNILDKHGDRKCNVYLLHGDLTEEEMTSLYKHPKVKCLISTTHGEGFGLPLFEAAHNGLPVITTNWSGQKDFLNIPQKNGKLVPHFLTVEYDLENVQKEAIWKSVIQEDSQWAFPREASFKRKMREVRKEYKKHKRRATKLQKYIIETFTEEKQYKLFVNSIIPYDLVEQESVDDLFAALMENQS